MKPVAVITTVGQRSDALELARAMVQHRLAACAQIEQVESFYFWEGTLQQEPEFRVLFKTTTARYGELELAIRALHPYRLPAIHAVAFEHAFEPYVRWIVEGTDSA
jgi:periplasmic divalent cation tolerance protein